METVAEFLASYPYAESTKRTYTEVLNYLLKQCADLSSLTAPQLLDIIQKSGWGNARQCLLLAASQKYLGWRFGSQHPALQARLKRITGKPQRALTKEQALELLASFDRNTAKGARDLAIACLAIDTGLRVSELCRLQLADTDLEHDSLQVIIKGGQWAAAVFSPQTAEHIRHWLGFRIVVDGQDFLFTNVFKGNGLTPEGLNKIVGEWGKKIGIKLSPHDFRRSFATLATAMMGAPERVLMEGGRWKDSAMIHRYTRTLKLEAMRKYLPTLALDNLER